MSLLSRNSRSNPSNDEDKFHQKVIHRVKADREIQSLLSQEDYAAVRIRIQAICNDALAEYGRNDHDHERTRLFDLILQEFMEYGPLETFLSDPKITDVRVLSWNQIWVAAPLKRVTASFENPQHLVRVINRIAALSGKTLNVSNPSVRFKTSDHKQITAIIPPVSPAGPVVYIRKTATSDLTSEDVIAFGTIHKPAMQFLSKCVQSGLNILIIGDDLPEKQPCCTYWQE